MNTFAPDTPQFPRGHQDWQTAALMAGDCPRFNPDVEEEQIADDPRSCYNCRYRRWSFDSITCFGDNSLLAAGYPG